MAKNQSWPEAFENIKNGEEFYMEPWYMEYLLGGLSPSAIKEFEKALTEHDKRGEERIESLREAHRSQKKEIQSLRTLINDTCVRAQQARGKPEKAEDLRGFCANVMPLQALGMRSAEERNAPENICKPRILGENEASPLPEQGQPSRSRTPYDADQIYVDNWDPMLVARKKRVIVHATQLNFSEGFTCMSKQGRVWGKPGDYLVIGDDGERWPCDRETFERTYGILNSIPEPDRSTKAVEVPGPNKIEGKDYKMHGVDNFIEACRKTNNMIAEEKQPTTWKDLTVCIDDLLNVVRQLASEAEENAKKVDSLWLRIRTLEVAQKANVQEINRLIEGSAKP